MLTREIAGGAAQVLKGYLVKHRLAFLLCHSVKALEIKFRTMILRSQSMVFTVYAVIKIEKAMSC